MRTYQLTHCMSKWITVLSIHFVCCLTASSSLHRSTLKSTESPMPAFGLQSIKESVWHCTAMWRKRTLNSVWCGSALATPAPVPSQGGRTPVKSAKNEPGRAVMCEGGGGETMPHVNPFMSPPEIQEHLVLSVETDDGWILTLPFLSVYRGLWCGIENRWLLLWYFVATLHYLTRMFIRCSVSTSHFNLKKVNIAQHDTNKHVSVPPLWLWHFIWG